MISQIDIDKIYFAKTKEYFNEVLSSYITKNYRSSIVMMYSVAVCDIMLKLEELRDSYNDTVASGILEKIQKSMDEQNGSKSKWEWQLIEEVKKKQALLI